MSDTIAWRDDYDIGIEIVDKAHQQLFMVVKRLLNLTSGGVKGKFAYAEGIQYLKGYTVRHFAEEEACMREVQFSNYEAHKKIHDTLREETIPALEKKIELWEYSLEVIEEFLGIYIGWLGCHIMMEDQMITGKIPVKSFIENATVQQQLERALPLVSEELFHEKTEVVRDRFVGDHFGDEVTYHYKLVYEAIDQGALRVCFSMEERMLQSMLKNILDIEEDISKRTLKTAIKMLAQAMVHRICAYVDIGDAQYQQASCVPIKEAEALAIYDETIKLFQKGGDACNIMLSTALGNFSTCIARVEN